MTAHPVTTTTILIVDDEPLNVHILRTALRHTGHNLVSARNGEEALQVAAATRPAIILLDLMMPPGIDGYETIRRLKGDPQLQSIPVVVLSSMNGSEDKVRALECGAVDFVSKPFSVIEVVARVRTHLTIRQLQADLAEQNARLERSNQRMKQDLEAAGRVQRAMLPQAPPECPGYQLGWMCTPCSEVGGDALDVYRIDADTLGFYLFDVSGHGVPAALLAVTVARSLTPRADRTSIVVEPGCEPGSCTPVSPAEVVRRLNALYPMDAVRNPHFITMVYGLLQTSTGIVRYACAGHPRPILIRADGTCASADAASPPIGLPHDARCEEVTLSLEPGDSLFLHSDGVSERKGPNDEEFGLARLRASLAGNQAHIQHAVENVAGQVASWGVPDAVADDLSLLGIRRESV